MNNISKRKSIWFGLGLLAIAMMMVTTGCAAEASAATLEYQTERIETGDLSANVVANGAVRPNRTQEIAWETSGVVEVVEVEFLDTVAEGEGLAFLEESSLPQSVILTQVDLINTQNELETLGNSDLAREEAYLAVVQAEEELADLADERYLMDYQRCRESTTDSLYADFLIAEDSYERLQDEYDEYYAHKAEDDLSRANALSNLTAARDDYDSALKNLEYCSNSADDQEVVEKDAEILVAEAKLADAQREWDRLKDGPDPDDIAVLEQRIMAYEATLAQASLTAPFDGYIVDSNVEPGDKVSTGMFAFQVEDQSHLYVDVDVSEIDINWVALDQEVMLTFDAAYDEIYQGKVVQIGASGTSDEGIVNFEVTIEVLNPDEDIKSGMTASASIQVESVEDVLLIPNRAIRVKDGTRVVYTWDGSEAEPQAVPITLGVTDGVMSQVLSGDLSNGDQVVLNPDILFEEEQEFGPGENKM